jgi:hypothetical protein
MLYFQTKYIVNKYWFVLSYVDLSLSLFYCISSRSIYLPYDMPCAPMSNLLCVLHSEFKVSNPICALK